MKTIPGAKDRQPYSLSYFFNIYSRLKGQATWSSLSRDTNSPYDDQKALPNGSPETREYMCIGVMEDTEVGQQSDIVTVVFGG